MASQESGNLRRNVFFGAAVLLLAVGTGLITGLLVNIFERKTEAREPYVRLVEVTEDTTDL